MPEDGTQRQFCLFRYDFDRALPYDGTVEIRKTDVRCTFALRNVACCR